MLFYNVDVSLHNTTSLTVNAHDEKQNTYTH
jgi:hypothetical protein